MKRLLLFVHLLAAGRYLVLVQRYVLLTFISLTLYAVM